MIAYGSAANLLPEHIVLPTKNHKSLLNQLQITSEKQYNLQYVYSTAWT